MLPMQKKPAAVFLISALFLLVFVALFLGRSADDNSLFSWSWVFVRADASRLYLVLIAGLVACAFLSLTTIPDNYEIPFLAVLSFAAIVPFWQEPEIIVDASRYFTQAKHLEMYGIRYFIKEWGGTIVAWTDMPLAPFLYGLIFKMFGENRTAIQIFTTSLFSLTTVLTCLIGQRLWNRETGLTGALLLLGIPYLLTQVPLMLVDVPTMFFFTLAVFAFLEALDRGGVTRIACSVASILCTVLSKYSAWFMLSVLAVILLVYSFQKGRPAVRRGIFILGAAGALSGMLLLLKWDVVSGQITLLCDYQKPGLARWGESFYSTFLFQIHPFITVFSLLSLAVAIRKRDAKYLIISWLFLPIVFFRINRIRYILPAFPMLALMAGYGLQIVRHVGLRRFIVYGTVTTSLAIAAFAYLPFARSMSADNLKQAGAYLDTLKAREIEVITLLPQNPVANPAVSLPLLDLFTSKRIRYRYLSEAYPPPDEVEKSPLRFTWAYKNPAYYRSEHDATCNMPVIVLSDVSPGRLPQAIARKLEGYRLLKEFTTSERVFQHSITVSLYEK